MLKKFQSNHVQRKALLKKIEQFSYAGKIGECDDLSGFDPVTSPSVFLLKRLCGALSVCSGQYLSKVVRGRNSGEPVTG